MEAKKIITIAKTAIATEIEGLKQLANTIDNSFVAAVNLIAAVKGKVVVSGIGKSGHIARKIAATLASTGTPAFFVHPSEALHGDLGMITTNDCVIMISNSGNSSELLGVLDYCLKYNIAIIALTNNQESDLAKAATILLQMPKAKEACPLNKAPTTSTTLAMVLGDCLAVALLTLKNFSCDDFKDFHPGGSLGAALKGLAEIMHKGDEVPIIKEDSNMKEALLVITSKRFGCTAVVNQEGVMIGIITDGDLRRHLNDNFLNLTATEVMTKNFTSASKDCFAAEALALMHSKKITNLFVLDGEQKPIGIIHIHDLTHIN